MLLSYVILFIPRTLQSRIEPTCNDLYKSKFLTAVLVSERYVETLLRDIFQPPDRSWEIARMQQKMLQLLQNL